MIPSASGGLVCGHRDFVSGAIRWFTRHRGEEPVFTNHVFVLEDNARSGAEALLHGVTRFEDYRAEYGAKKYWCVTFACVPNEPERPFDREVVDVKLEEYVGRDYDKLAIVKQALDGIAGKILGRDVFWFRRIRLRFWERQERWVICSWLWCHTHRHARWRVWGSVTQLQALECHRVPPNDIERDVFLHRPDAYLITDELGERPRDLPERYIHKIESDITPRTPTAA